MYYELLVNGTTSVGASTNINTAVTSPSFRWLGGDGANANAIFHWGQIAAFTYYSQKLSDAEISDIYAANKSKYGLP